MTVGIYKPDMEPDAKRPRMSLPPPWSNTPSHQGISLPPPPQGVTAPHPPHPSSSHHPSPYSPHPYSPHPHSRAQEHHSNSAQHHVQHHHDDRRHYEKEPYPPMQDSHRQPPPPSPSHPSAYGHNHMDTMIKRDPGGGDESTLSQMRRPNSTGNAPDGLPPTTHGPPHSGPHADGRQLSFDNGASVPVSPVVYRPPPTNYHPTPVPISHPPYEPPTHGYGPPPIQAPEMYPNVTITHAAKRKAQRASQACEMCRQLKAKCDEQKPCKNCKEKNQDCIYRETPVKQTDKVSESILEAMIALKKEVSEGFSKIDKLDERMTQMENTIKRSSQTVVPKVEPSIEEDNTAYQPSPFEAVHDHDEMQTDETPRENQLEVSEVQKRLQDADENEIEDQPGPPVDPGQPSMPTNHTTLASLLLNWSSVRELVKGTLESLQISHLEGYHLHQERKRGVARVFGRGEGSVNGARTPHHGSLADQTMMLDIPDDVSDVASSPSPSLLQDYGQTGGLTPPADFTYKSGVLTTEGTADFDKAKVESYVQSFKDNMLNMHPVLDPRYLDDQVKDFLETMPRALQKHKPSTASTSAKWVTPSGVPTGSPSISEAAKKRKWSPAADEPNPSVGFQKPGRPYRNVSSALVLVVLALGKICQVNETIPDVVRESSETQSHNSPMFRNGVAASPTHGSPPGYLAQSQSSGLPSPKESDLRHSRRSSLQGATPVNRVSSSMKRNFEVIPGLEYYALATDILGGLMGGPTLRLVWVYLFMGLYQGQLGRVVESWSFINLASRDLQVVLQPSLDRLREMKGGNRVPVQKRDNLLAFAYWTCVQLESDILAELPLPPSGILQWEELMPYPNMGLAHDYGYSQYVISSYSAQLYLRKQLNSIHNRLYNPRYQPDPSADSGMEPKEATTVEGKVLRLQMTLKDPRKDSGRPSWVPREYEFEDNDPPAQDILAARLRAKYWGSQVILYRPFVKAIAESEPVPADMFREPHPPPPSDWARQGLNVGNVKIQPGVDPRMVHYARLGIEGLIESTRAFHGMDPTKRIIITNVFGTAHAQWGNLITLGACYKNPILSNFVNREVLADLFNRTIQFFRLIIPSMSTTSLRSDMELLEGLSKELGFPSYPRAENETQTYPSFSNPNGLNYPLPGIRHRSGNYSPDVTSHPMPPPPNSRP